MANESALFSDKFKEEQGIEFSPAGSEPEEGQENKTDTESDAQEQTQEGEQTEQSSEGAAETEQTAAEESQTTEEQTGEEATQKEESTEESQTEQPALDLESLNKFFEKDFKDENEVRGVFERAEKASDYDEKVNKLSEYESTLKEKDSKIKELESSFDEREIIEKYFSSDNAFKSEAIKKQMPNKDPILIEKMINSDLSKVDDFDVLVDEYLLDNPGFGGNRTRAANVIMSDYNIDPEDNTEEWSQVVKDKLMVSATKARDRVKEMSESIELPEVVRPEDRAAAKEQQQKELKESWKEPINRIAQYEKEVIADDKGNKLFEFTVPEDYKSQITDYVDAMVTNGELPANQDTVQFAEAMVRQDMISKNLPKILKVYESELESKWQQKKDKEEGNSEPPNKQTAPEGRSEEGKMPGLSDMLRDMDGSTGDTIG